jgi:hypothetical protein
MRSTLHESLWLVCVLWVCLVADAASSDCDTLWASGWGAHRLLFWPPPRDNSSTWCCNNATGVSCNGQGNVTALIIRDVGLSGLALPTVASLRSLRHLDLAGMAFETAAGSAPKIQFHCLTRCMRVMRLFPVCLCVFVCVCLCVSVCVCVCLCVSVCEWVWLSAPATDGIHGLCACY